MYLLLQYSDIKLSRVVMQRLEYDRNEVTLLDSNSTGIAPGLPGTHKVEYIENKRFVMDISSKYILL